MKFKVKDLMKNGKNLGMAAAGGAGARFVTSDKFPVKKPLLQKGIIAGGALLLATNKDTEAIAYGMVGALGYELSGKALGLSGYDDSDINGIFDKLDTIEAETGTLV